MALKLVPNWRELWKAYSVVFPAINTAFLATWATLPEKFQDVLPTWAVLSIAVFLIVAGVIGRFIKQPEPGVITEITVTPQAGPPSPKE
jgi:hypothetical protein